MTPDYVLDASGRLLGSLLPYFRRTPGAIADQALYSAYHRILNRLISDTRAAARSTTLSADLLAITDGYRAAASDMRQVVDGLDRVIVAARAFVPVAPTTGTRALQRQHELALAGLIEWLAVAVQAEAVAALNLRSHDEARLFRARLGRTFDIAIERAADAGAIDALRQLRHLQGLVARDLIERGRPLARILAYESAVPLPSVVLAHELYQDAERAEELRLENAAHDHPAFMPMAGRALST